MRIIAVSTLREFWERDGRHDAEQPLRAWVQVVRAAEWSKPTDVKLMFNSADILANNRVVFDIAATNIGWWAIHYRGRRVYVRFIGTHAEYDESDAATI